MALTDTAEYWQDVKKNYPYVGPNFHHIPNADCGHRHLFEAKRLGNVNCYACLELIKNGYAHGLEEGEYMTKGEKKRKNAKDRVKQKILETEKQYGKCVCSGRWVTRQNKSTQESFLGCSNYPKCKCTKKI